MNQDQTIMSELSRKLSRKVHPLKTKYSLWSKIGGKWTRLYLSAFPTLHLARQQYAPVIERLQFYNIAAQIRKVQN